MSHGRRNSHSREKSYKPRQKRLKSPLPEFTVNLEPPPWVAGTELSRPIDLRKKGDKPSVEANAAPHDTLQERVHLRGRPESGLPLTGGAKERSPAS